jgi:hypothetical protein
MPADSPPRVQFVVSGKFLIFLLLATGLLSGGYYWHTRQVQAHELFLQTQERFKTPPYFVNRGATVIRPCKRCVELGKLKPEPEWQIGPPTEVPATEQRWFLAAEDPPLPVEVAGVLMLPAHPALGDNPALGFDRTRVLLVLFQGLQRMTELAQLPPPPPPNHPPADTAALSPYLGDWKNEDPNTRGTTRFSVAEDQGKLVVHAWGKCVPSDCDWKDAEASLTDEGLSPMWNFGFATSTWQLSPESDERLKQSRHTHYPDGRTDQDDTAYFIRPTEGQQ